MQPAIKAALQKASNCPFCGADKKHLDISCKTPGHVCVYCRKCRTYGPRVLEYSLPDAIDKGYNSRHWFKTLNDLKKNSDGQSYHPTFVKVDDSEISHDWYYEEAIRIWNERVKQDS